MKPARCLAALVLAATAAGAVEIRDARLERRTLADPAAALSTLSSDGRDWLAWTVPGAAALGDTCCFRRNWRERGCVLDGKDHGTGTTSNGPKAGPGNDLVVLVEIDHGRPRRLRAVADSCPIDGAGRRVVALDGVDPERSLALLESWARDPRVSEDAADPALAGMAYHGHASVVPRLERLALDRKIDSEIRNNALFWMAQTGAPGVATRLLELIASESDEEIREQGVFALSQLDDGALYLARLLRESAHADVRRQALFWLGQSEDPRALAEIEKILDR